MTAAKNVRFTRQIPKEVREQLFWIAYFADSGDYTFDELLSMIMSI
jgi:hypothetical protein